eukprot:CAMPEP_0196578302 /NCGR_PEP_ID=MMETSP1081-20130531/7216_1 /TAXON_ID=36882 /ORGANISM="Pyramimonas amylifera, Strain CCMP720" /LENGTH=860 /DNA_ID=CAMNT_0041897469 /DNA_START=1 /DNA_END=2583 /DNA_ORIENTATION=-
MFPADDGSVVAPSLAFHSVAWMGDGSQLRLTAFGGSLSARTRTSSKWNSPSVGLRTSGREEEVLDVIQSNQIFMWNPTLCGLSLESNPDPNCGPNTIEDVAPCGVPLQTGLLTLIVSNLTETQEFVILVNDALSGNLLMTLTNDQQMSNGFRVVFLLFDFENRLVVSVDQLPMWKDPMDVMVKVENGFRSQVSLCALRSSGNFSQESDICNLSLPIPLPSPTLLAPVAPASPSYTANITVALTTQAKSGTISWVDTTLILQDLSLFSSNCPEVLWTTKVPRACYAYSAWNQASATSCKQFISVPLVQLGCMKNFRLVALDDRTRVIVATSEDFKVHAEAPANIVPVLIETGTIKVTLSHDSCISQPEEWRSPAIGIRVSVEQYNVPISPPLPGNSGNPASYTFVNANLCQLSNQYGDTVLQVYTSVRHRLHFHHPTTTYPLSVSCLPTVYFSGSEFAGSRIVSSLQSQTNPNHQIQLPVAYDGIQPLFCCGLLTMTSSQGLFPSPSLAGLASPGPNSTCQFLIVPASPSHIVHLVLDRSGMMPQDRISVFFNSQLIGTRYGPDSVNWTVSVQARNVLVTFRSGSGLHPLGAGFIATYTSEQLDPSVYMVMMAVVIFVVSTILLVGVMFTWRHTSLLNRCLGCLGIFCLRPPRGRRARASDEVQVEVVTVPVPQSLQLAARPTRCLSHSMMAKLPILTYTKPSPALGCTPEQLEEEEGVCSICLSEYEHGQAIRKLPCSHQFHNDCIIPWLKRERTCPYCKADIAIALAGVPSHPAQMLQMPRPIDRQPRTSPIRQEFDSVTHADTSDISAVNLSTSSNIFTQVELAADEDHDTDIIPMTDEEFGSTSTLSLVTHEEELAI